MRKASFLLAFGLAMLLPRWRRRRLRRAKSTTSLSSGSLATVHAGAGVPTGIWRSRWRWVEDVAIAARCKNPMVDQAEHNYTVVDPYYDFFGMAIPS